MTAQPATGPCLPPEPALRGGVAVLGCGAIARSAHLPAYARHGIGVVGVWSRSPASTAGLGLPVYGSAEELLADPRVRVVDIATPTEGRLAWIEAAVDAGKHVLAQKPLTSRADELARLPGLLARAAERGLRVAVNHNGRWAPAWRLTTLLARSGAVGEVVGVTHLHDKPLPPLVGTPFDDLPHMLLADYLVHWLDITRCWLEPAQVTTVTATDSRVPGQPPGAKNPWSATVSLQCDTGATALVRIAGDVRAARPSCPFWLHGTQGTLRGSVLTGSDRLALDRGDDTEQLPLSGTWFVDAFAATMGELLCAVAEDREPEHSAAHAAGSVRLVLAAVQSAAQGGRPVPVEAAA